MVGIWHALETCERNTKCWSKNLSARNHFKDRGIEGRIILKSTVKNWYLRVWIGLINFRSGPSKHRNGSSENLTSRASQGVMFVTQSNIFYVHAVIMLFYTYTDVV